jgi:hypothetical protein
MIWKEMIVVLFEILSYILSGGTGLNDLEIGVRFPAGARDVSLIHIVHAGSGVQ